MVSEQRRSIPLLLAWRHLSILEPGGWDVQGARVVPRPALQHSRRVPNLARLQEWECGVVLGAVCCPCTGSQVVSWGTLERQAWA